MTEYRIDPSGVTEVLTNLQPQSDNLLAQANLLPGVDSSIRGALDDLPNLITAVSAFLDSQLQEIVDVTSDIAACTLGAQTGVNAYVNADYEMNENVTAAQAAAVSAAGDGDFSYFFPEGV